MGRSIERAAAKRANKRMRFTNSEESVVVTHEDHDDEECSLASDEEIGDDDDEDLDDEQLDHSFDKQSGDVSVAAASFSAAAALSSTSSAATTAEYTYPEGIQFVPMSKTVLRGNDLLQCTSLGWRDGSSPSTASVKRAGKECAKDLQRITYDELTTQVSAKTFATGMNKEGKNVGPASTLAVNSWHPNTKEYRKVFNALFNGGVGGNNRYGGGKMRMRQTTPGVVLHERLHGDGVGHSNRWSKLNKKDLEKFMKVLKRKHGVAPKGYTQINGEWHIFQSSRDGFCSVMNIFGKRNYLPVPIMIKIAYQDKQVAIYPFGAPSITYNLQDVMAPQKDGVLNGVKIMMGAGEEPLYLGLYTGSVSKKDEPTTLLAFHTATGKGNNVGSTRWCLGKSLTFSERNVYARLVEEGSEVWKVEVGRISQGPREIMKLGM